MHKIQKTSKKKAEVEIVKALNNSELQSLFNEYGLSGDNPIGLTFGLSVSDFKNRQAKSEELNVVLKDSSQEHLLCICCWDPAVLRCREK